MVFSKENKREIRRIQKPNPDLGSRESYLVKKPEDRIQNNRTEISLRETKRRSSNRNLNRPITDN